jgi:hypothetical protein
MQATAQPVWSQFDIYGCQDVFRLESENAPA